MCGILGYYSEGGISAEALREALHGLDLISHRGPDGSGGVLINSRTGEFKTIRTPGMPADLSADIETSDYADQSFDLFLGHRRLSIIDLSSAGHQPMRDRHGNWITFNGEVYNYIELREELRNQGVQFVSGSDTEVVMAALHHWGEECINRFNGMWAFAFWRNKDKKLIWSKDRFNIKPFYYLKSEREILFGSEIKSFMAFRGRVGEYHSGNIQAFLDMGFLDIDDSTFFKNVFRFPSSMVWAFSPSGFLKGELTQRKYWQTPATIDFKIQEPEAIEEFRFLVEDSVKLRMRADVEWGITMSGGVDSSLVALKAWELQGKPSGIKSFSAVFPGQEGDESEFIRIMGDHLKLDPHFINPMDIFSTEKLVENIWYYDFPSQGTSFFSEYAVMRLAKQAKIKVLLEGQGGDELFGGYHHHFTRYMRELALHFRFSELTSNIKEWSEMKGVPTKSIWQNLKLDLKYFAGSKLGRNGDSKVSKWMSPNSLRDFLEVDMFSFTLPAYLRTDDRDAMANGIENRVPLVDFRLVEFAFRLPSRYKIHKGWQKYLMRKAMDGLDDRIRWRKDKKGFTTPAKEWISSHKHEWTDYINETRLSGFQTGKGKDDHERIFRDFSLGVWLKLQSSMSSPAFFRSGEHAVRLSLDTTAQHGGVRICSRCVLDTENVPELTFDKDGVCHYCRKYEIESLQLPHTPSGRKEKLDALLSTIKNEGQGKKYDCILGVSGGVDSSYLLCKAKDWGLRPLVLHFDNGWNSELAVRNIQLLLDKLGFDLETYVVNWNEFRDLQLSYIKAGVLDWEIPTDHGFLACLYLTAAKHGIKSILSGHNFQTEAILPVSMRWSKMDVANILDIHSKHGKVPLKTMPLLPFFRYSFFQGAKGIKKYYPLNYLEYDKSAAKEYLKSEIGWQDYGGKHGESIFTRFYQGYVLPKRFHIDKRRAHLSTMINSGLISREDAMKELEQPPYDSKKAEADLEFVIKKLGITEMEFKRYMEMPIHSHLEFRSYETGLFKAHARFFELIRPVTRVIKSLTGKPLLSETPQGGMV